MDIFSVVFRVLVFQTTESPTVQLPSTKSDLFTNGVACMHGLAEPVKQWQKMAQLFESNFLDNFLLPAGFSAAWAIPASLV